MKITVIFISIALILQILSSEKIGVLTDHFMNLRKDVREIEFCERKKDFILKQSKIPYCRSLINQLERPNKETFNQPCNEQNIAMEPTNMYTNFCLNIYDKLKRDCDIDYWDYYDLIK